MRDQLLTASQVAARLAVHRSTVHRLGLPYHRIGRCVRWAEADVEAFIASTRRLRTVPRRGESAPSGAQIEAEGDAFRRYFGVKA